MPPEEPTEESEDEEDAEIVIVPTSHVSEKSSELVTETILETQPDIVALELDQRRLENLTKRLQADDQSKPVDQESSTRKILTNQSLPLKSRILLAGISKFQSSIKDQLPIDMTGKDMLSGLKTATDLGLPVATVDRDITETFTRLGSVLSLTQILKITVFGVIGYIHLRLSSDKQVEEQVEVENIDEDEINRLLEEQLPEFKSVFLDERNDIIAQNTANLLSNESYSSIVLVIGSAHKSGVIEQLQDYTPESVSIRVAES